MRRLIALAVAVLLLAGCSGAAVATATPPTAPSPATGSGDSLPSLAGGPPRVTGFVTAGPVCPVEKTPPDPSCAPRPVAGAVIVATNAAGAEVGRAITAPDGSFEMVMGATGTMTLTAQPVAGLLGTPPPVKVTLGSPGQVERVDLAYDTGIR